MNPEIAPPSDENLIRLTRPSLVVLCGPAGSGKSTFAKRHFRPTQVVSSDWARGLVCDDESDQRFNAQAFELVHFLVNQRLGLNRLCVVDSTALSAQARNDLLALARKNQVPTAVILFAVSLATCIERDEKRERAVGKAVLARQFENFEQSRASIRREGFDQVLELQAGDADNIRFEIVFRPIQRLPRTDARPSPQHNRSGIPIAHRQNGNGHSPALAAGEPVVQPGAQNRPKPSPRGAPPQTVTVLKIEEALPASKGPTSKSAANTDPAEAATAKK